MSARSTPGLNSEFQPRYGRMVRTILFHKQSTFNRYFFRNSSPSYDVHATPVDAPHSGSTRFRDSRERRRAGGQHGRDGSLPRGLFRDDGRHIKQRTLRAPGGLANRAVSEIVKTKTTDMELYSREVGKLICKPPTQVTLHGTSARVNPLSGWYERAQRRPHLQVRSKMLGTMIGTKEWVLIEMK